MTDDYWIEYLAGAAEGIHARLDEITRHLGIKSPTTAIAPIAMIITDAADLSGRPVNDIVSDRKSVQLSHLRHGIAWVARETTAYSLPRIAAALHRSDHSTISSSLRRAEELRASDPVFLARTNELRRRAEARAINATITEGESTDANA